MMTLPNRPAAANEIALKRTPLPPVRVVGETAIGVTVVSDDDAFVRAVQEYLSSFVPAPESTPAVRYTLVAPPPVHSATNDTPCSAWVNDRLVRQTPTAVGLLDALEWDVNGTLVARHDHYVTLHAGVVGWQGRGLVLPAQSGTGKTSLTTALLRQGWAYLSDEAAVLDPATAFLLPYPKPVSIKNLEWLNAQIDPLPTAAALWNMSTSEGARIHPRHFAIVQQAPLPIGWIVFPSGRAEQPALRRLPSRIGLQSLLHNCFNPDLHGAAGVRLLTEIVRSTPCYDLTLGPPAATAALLTRVLIGG